MCGYAPIAPAEILEVYPPSPGDLGAERIDELWGELRHRAEATGDSQPVLAMTLHHAGALAYVGDKHRAAAIIPGEMSTP